MRTNQALVYVVIAITVLSGIVATLLAVFVPEPHNAAVDKLITTFLAIFTTGFMALLLLVKGNEFHHSRARSPASSKALSRQSKRGTCARAELAADQRRKANEV